MSKIYDALKHAERERSTEQGEALARLLTRAAEERETLRAEVRACQEQLAALATRVDAVRPIDPASIDDLVRRVAHLAAQQDRLASEPPQLLDDVLQPGTELSALESKLEALGAQQQRTHERIDRSAKDLGGAVQDLYARTDDLGHETEQARDSLQADVASVRQQLGEALHDRDERLGQLAQAVRSSQSEQQLVLAELRQQMAAMEMLHTSSRSEVRELVESAGDRAGDAVRRLEALTGSLQNHDALLGRIQTAQAELKTLVQRSEKRVRELASEAAHGADQQAQRSEALGAALESLSTRLADTEAAGRGAAERWGEDLERLRAAAAEANAAVDAATTGRIEEVRTQLDAIHERLAGADAAQRSLQQRWEEQLAEQRQALSSLSTEALRVADGYRGESQAAQRDLGARLDASLAAQSESDGRLRAVRDAVEAALATQERAAGELDALRAQVAPLAESQARLQDVADGVGRAQSTADEALSRVAAVDGLRAASLAALRQQISAVQADSASLREAVQASLAAQQQAASEIDALRTQLTPLAEAHARLQSLGKGVGRAQSTADEATRRVAAIDGALAASLGTLRQQIAALQVDRASLREVVELAQASVAAQQQAAGDIDALRAQVAPLADAQARLQEVADGLGRAQATADEAAHRIAAIDGALAAVYKST